MMKLLLAVLIAVCAQTGAAQTSVTEAQRHFERGLALKTGEAAEQEFRRAIELDERFVEAHRELQDLVVRKGEPAKVPLIQEYRAKADANPHSALHHYLLARLLEGKDAETEFRRALELDGNAFWPRYGLMFHHYETGEHKEADAELPRVMALIPQSTYAYIKLANGLARYQRAEDALEILETARTKLGNDAQSLQQISTLTEQISQRITSNLVAFLSYLLATLICSAFAGWTTKEAFARKTHRGEDSAGMIMIFYSGVWFLVLCICSARGNNVMTGFRNTGMPEFLMLLLVAFWPTVLYHTTLVEKSRTVALGGFYRFMTAYFYLMGIALAALFSYGVYGLPNVQQSTGPWIDHGFKVFLANFVLAGILNVTMTIKANRQKPAVDPEAKAARRWELVLLVLFLFLFFPLGIIAIFQVTAQGEDFLGFVSTLMPLPFIMAAFYYEARYAFMDVFIKKSTVVVLMVLVSGVYYLLVVGKAASWGLSRNSRFAEWIILLPLICALPFLARLIERWVDRYVFGRRRAPSEVLSGFSRAIRRLESQEQLVQTAAVYIQEVFQARKVWIGRLADSAVKAGESVEQLEELASKWKGAVVTDQLADSDSWKSWLVARGMDVVTALRTGGEVVLYLSLGRRQIRDPYWSGDIDLLNSLTDQLEFALETVRLERERGEQELKQQELKVLAGKAELKALRAQINPHFLFNALNTISSLIRRNPAKAEETVETLADVFRHALAESGREFIPLVEELEFINAYLDIEKARFGSKLKIEIDIQREAEAVRIPAMVLQPLVENAVKHGIAPKVAGGKVRISAHCRNGTLEMEVADDGVGFEQAHAPRLYHDGLGVRNVRDRLQGIYGQEGRFSIESAVNQGTRIHIVIPIQTAEP